MAFYLPPDVNRSSQFTPEAAVAGIGDSAEKPPPAGIAILLQRDPVGSRRSERGAGSDGAGHLERESEASSRRSKILPPVDARVANRKILENLIRCGAFDFLGRERAALFACIDESMAAAAASQKDRASGQVSLFEDMPAPASKPTSHRVIPWTEHEKMSYEKELLGFYVTGHPLDAYAAVLRDGKYQTITSLNELADRASFKIAGAIVQVDKKFTKKEGKPFAVVFLEDLTATLEVVLWNEVYTTVSEALVLGRVLAVTGTLDKRDDSLRAVAQRAKVLSTATGPVRLPNESNGNGNGNGSAAKECRWCSALIRGDVRRIAPGADCPNQSPGTQPVRLMFCRADGGF
jgi:DNA polymerase-3 subunit alpha